jgi:hypothetical protein
VEVVRPLGGSHPLWVGGRARGGPCGRGEARRQVRSSRYAWNTPREHKPFSTHSSEKAKYFNTVWFRAWISGRPPEARRVYTHRAILATYGASLCIGAQREAGGGGPAATPFRHRHATIAHKPVSKRACEGVPRSTAWRSCRKRGGREVMRWCTTQHALGLLAGTDCSPLALTRAPTLTHPPRAPTRPQPPSPAAPAGSTCSVPDPRRPTDP